MMSLNVIVLFLYINPFFPSMETDSTRLKSYFQGLKINFHALKIYFHVMKINFHVVKITFHLCRADFPFSSGSTFSRVGMTASPLTSGLLPVTIYLQRYVFFLD